MVEKERESIYSQHFDEDFLNHCLSEREQQKRKNSKKSIVYEVCRHELWSNTTSEGLDVQHDQTKNTGTVAPFSNTMEEDFEEADDDNSVGLGGFTFEA